MVELLVAIAIMGILTLLSLPTIEGIRTRNNESTYKKYEESLVSSAKIYADSYDVDMFAYNENGCTKIPYQTLKEKNLLKDIQVKDANCNNADTYVIVKKVGGKFQYQQQMTCKDPKGKVLYENKIGAEEVICGEETAQEGPKITVTGRINEFISEGDYTVKVDVEDIDGLLANNKAEYKWATDAEGIDIVTENELNFRNSEGDKTAVKKIPRPEDDGEYYLIITPTNIRDVFGNYNTEVVVSGPYIFDSSAPECPAIITNVDEKTWTNQDIEFTFEFEEGTTEYDWITYVNGEKEAESTNAVATNTKTLSASGERTIKIIIRDSIGHTRTCGTDKEYYIDKEAPTCEIEKEGTKGEGSWFKSDVTMNLKVEDTLSGVNKKTLNTAEEMDEILEEITTGTETEETTGTEWYGHVVDNAGNIGKCQTTVKKDTVKPSCKINTDPKADASGWYNEAVELELKPSDSTSKIEEKGLTTSTKVTYNGNTTAKQPTTDTDKTWYGYVKDKAGNENVCSKRIQIDTTIASCQITAESSSKPKNEWYKDDVKLTVKPTGTTTDVTEIGISTSATPTYNGNSTATQTADTSGTTWYGYIKTAHGKEANCSITIQKDSTAPSCSIVPSGTKGEDDWYRTDVAIKLEPTDTGGSGVADTGLSYESLAKAKENNLTKNTQTANTTRTWYGHVVDKAGNEASCTKKVKKDSVKPSCSISTSGTMDKDVTSTWYKGNVTLTMTTSDALSGVSSTYGLSTSSGSTNKSKTGTQTADTTKTTWYGYVKDKAGNTASCSKNVYKDATAPTITVYKAYDSGKCKSFIDGGNTIIYRKPAIFYDKTSGLKKLYYKYEYSDSTVDGDWMGNTISMRRSNSIILTRNIHDTPTKIRQDYNLTTKADSWFSFKAMDKAGNTATVKNSKADYDGSASSSKSGKYCRKYFPTGDTYANARSTYKKKCSSDSATVCYYTAD